MKYKKGFIFICLIICLFSIASVCASDVNDTLMANEDDIVVELSQGDVDEMAFSEENEIIGQTGNEELISEGNTGTFAELQANITAATKGSTLTLNKNYQCEDGFDTLGIIIDKSITIDGNGSKIDAQGKSRIFKITAANVILKNIIFTNGKIKGNGGAVFFDSTGTVTNCNFTNNFAYNGGAIYGEGTILNCRFINNSASDWGGAIFISSGNVTNCNFINNTIDGDVLRHFGGAIYFEYGGILTDCNFTNNFAYNGGAIYGGETILNCRFINNSAFSGGAIHNAHNIINCLFINNSANNLGGAVDFDYSYTLKDCNFTNNYANSGGAISFGDDCILTDCNFNNNQATDKGGAIFFLKSAEVTNCNFTNNSASNTGGAIYLSDDNNFFENCIINNNSAVSGASAIQINGKSYFYNCSFDNNSGGRSTISSSGSSLFIQNCIFLNNKIALVCNSESLKIFNSNFTNNYGGTQGAIDCSAKNARIEGCNFKDNHINTQGAGGAFKGRNTNYSKNYLIINSNFTNNYATFNSLGGGAIYKGGTILNCRFIDNYVVGSDTIGGAIAYANSISNCYFSNNVAKTSSAVYGCNNISNSIFINNTHYSKPIKCDDCSNINNCSFDGDYYNYSLYIDTNNKISSNISINASNFDAGEIIIISANILPTAMGNITFIINNDSYNISLVRGEANLILPPLKTGDYYVKATYLGDDCYSSNTVSTTFKVIGGNSKLNLTFENNLVAGNNTIINISLNEDAQGEIVLNIFDDEIFKEVHDGKAQVYIPNLKGGQHNFTLKYMGDYKYNPLQITDVLNVDFKQSFIKVNIENYVFGDIIIINPIITQNATGDIALYVDEEFVQNISLNNSFELKGLNAGIHKLKLLFSGDEYYSFSEYVTNLTINALPTTTFINVNDTVYYGENVIVNVKTSASGKITIQCGIIVKSTDVFANNITSIDLGILPVGSYQIIANFTSGSNYVDSSNSTHVNILNKINENDVNISIPEIKANQENSIIISLPNDATGEVTLTIDNIDYKFVVKEGVVNITVPQLSEGCYNYIITYSGDNQYTSFTKMGSLIVDKFLPTTIILSSVTTVYNGGKYLVATLKDINGNVISGVKLILVLNGKTYTPITDANGQVKVSTNGLAPKIYTASITFAGNTNYVKSTGSAKVTVTKATPKITAKAKIFKRTVKTKKYSITLKTNQNKVMKSTKVYIKVNKKTYAAKTNSRGVATFKITKLTKKGRYTAVVTYKGNAYYNKLTKKVKITVK